MDSLTVFVSTCYLSLLFLLLVAMALGFFMGLLSKYIFDYIVSIASLIIGKRKRGNQ
jgi:ABC-type dipeptide/oligopeptide/nickel transport system permease component